MTKLKTPRLIPPKILSTKSFRQYFFECMRLQPVALTIVSPFIGPIPGYGDIVSFSRHVLNALESKLTFITLPPDDARIGIISISQAEMLSTLGVDIYIRAKPKLHSKVYLFEFRNGKKLSFVGSANFSGGGFKNNEETVAYFLDDTSNNNVAKEVVRLSGFGSEPYGIWKTNKNRIAKGANHGRA